jgi:hypothetical protein
LLCLAEVAFDIRRVEKHPLLECLHVDLRVAHMALWVQEFYQLQWTKTLAEACEMATMQSGAKMKLMPRHTKDGPTAAVTVDANPDGACAIEPT